MAAATVSTAAAVVAQQDSIGPSFPDGAARGGVTDQQMLCFSRETPSGNSSESTASPSRAQDSFETVNGRHISIVEGHTASGGTERKENSGKHNDYGSERSNKKHEHEHEHKS